jgi:hypothetical protein
MSLRLITETEKLIFELYLPTSIKGVKMYTPSNAGGMSIDLSAKKICFFVAERLLAGMFHLLQYPVVWHYVLQHLQ